MKKLKICTIMAAVAVASSLYTAPTFAAEANNNIGLELASVESNVSTNSVKATFKVTNNGTAAINLSDVKLRYYYTADNQKEQEFHCYNADIPTPYRSVTSNVSGKFVTMEKAMEGADTYLEIGFDSSAGTLEAGQTVSIQSNFNKKDWSNYNQANDYSFNNADKTVVLVGGVVVKGTVPSTEVVVTPTDSSTSAVNTDAKVEVSVSNGTSANSVTPKFTVTNTSGADLDLTTLNLKYYYTADGDEAQTFNCYYAGTVGGTYQNLTGNVVGKIIKLDTAQSNADSYVQVTFNGGTLAAGQSMEVQASVNKDGWTNYDQSNDYSYNAGDKVTAAVNDTVIWGTAPGPVVVVPSSKLSINSVNVDKANLSDIVVGVELNGNVFEGITGLVEGTDYTVATGGSVTISKDYLGTLPVGTKNLTFKFDKGNAQTLKVNVINSKIVQDSLITPTSGEYNVKNKADIKVEMTLNGNKLVDIKNNGVVLKEGSDYTVSGTTVTLTQAYLDTLTVGQAAKLTFDFSEGNAQTLTVNVINGVEEGLVLNIPDVTGKAGETITIPLTITGITADGLNGCNFKIKYDPELFENATITAGDILVNPTKTLFKVIDSTTGVISIMYADSTGKETEAIVKDGLFMNINLKIKDTAKSTTSKIEVTKPGTFVDKQSDKYVVSYKVGTITIGGDVVVVDVDPTLSTATENFDKTTPADVKVGVSLNGKELTQVQNGATILVKDTDYTFDGTNVTLSKNYLSTLPVGSTDLTFKFSNGKEVKLTVNVTETVVPVVTTLSASIGKIDAKAGDTITLPVTLTAAPEAGIANFAYRIKYDPSLVEVVGVEAGSAITNPEVNFISDVYADKKIISILFIDSAMTDAETIKTAGGLANIKLKIKDTATKGVMPIEFNDDDHSFYDINGNEIKLTFTNGSINVQ